jgi:hypothetical protein
MEMTSKKLNGFRFTVAPSLTKNQIGVVAVVGERLVDFLHRAESLWQNALGCAREFLANCVKAEPRCDFRVFS